MVFSRKVKEYTEAPITHNIVAEMLPEYNRPNDKISELIKSGELVSIRRGLYIPGPETDLPIPERVYEVSSVTLKTTKTYTTPIGRFSYQHLAAPYYSFGIQSVKLTSQQTALIASPEKALCDKIILTSGILLRSITQTQDFLLDDMRMDEEMLRTLNISTIHSWLEDAPKKNSLKMLIKTLEQV